MDRRVTAKMTGKGPLQILQLDDDAASAEQVAKLLRGNGLHTEVQRVGTLDDFRRALEVGRHALVLAEEATAAADAREALRVTREARPELPFIVLSRSTREEAALELLELGATDFVAKSQLERLVSAVRSALHDPAEQRRRRQAQAELRVTAERLSLAQQAGGVGLFDWNLVTGDVYWTPELEEIFGLRRGSFSRRYDDWARRVHPADLPRIEALFADWMVSDRNEERWEYRILRSGEERWIAARARMVRDSAGRPARMVGTHLCVTKAKRAESERERLLAEARRQAAELGAVFEAMTDGLAVYGPAGELVRTNSAVHSLVGSQQDDLGQTLERRFELLRPTSGEGTRLDPRDAPAARALRGEVVCDELLVLRRADGAERWCAVSAAPIRIGTEIAGAVISFRDITAQKQAQDDLARSEAILAQAGQMAHLGAWWIDLATVDGLERNRLWWSDEVYRIFGYQPGEVAVTPVLFLERVHPEDRARVRAALAQAIAEGRSYEAEHRIVRPDGSERVVLEHAQIHYDRDGRPRRAVGAVQDVTERKQAEHALREADRNKTEFLAMLSHELRNPLAPIRNSIYILERAQPDGEQARRARTVIDRQVRQMTRLIDDLLDVTRISRGKIRLQRERLDLCSLVRRTAEDHRSEFERSGVRFELALEEAPLDVHGDPTRLAQIVGNLLQNAAKFTPPGGRARLELRRRGDRVLIVVGDTGVGIAPEMLRQLFVPFVQSEHTLDRSRGGLGLGLALVSGLVALHGGSVSARSEGMDRGAEFVVELPLEPKEARRPALQPQPSAPPAPRRVLVIEDNVDAAESLKEALELDHYVVEVAYTGPAGLEKARRFRPDVVVCDIGLPGMNGYEVARAMRSDPELKSSTLVALSGYAPADELLREAGFRGYLPKPPDLAALERVLTAAPPGSGAEPPRPGH